MTKKISVFLFVLVLSGAYCVPAARAQDAGSSDQVTQGELAVILVNATGLARFVPANPTTMDYVELCLLNKMSPAEGWDIDAVVTRAVLARLVLQAMDEQSNVENPDDPRSWVAYLRSLGISFDTISEATADLEPKTEPVAPNVIYFSTSTDPLDKQKPGEPDNLEYGTDMEFVASLRPLEYPVTLPEVEEVITKVTKRKKRKPVTED